MDGPAYYCLLIIGIPVAPENRGTAPDAGPVCGEGSGWKMHLTKPRLYFSQTMPTPPAIDLAVTDMTPGSHSQVGIATFD
jgi:hypothetical protein